MSGMLVMTVVGIVLTGLALAGLVRLRGAAQLMFCVGMLLLAAAWFIPVILSILLQSGFGWLPWPTNAIVNVILHSTGAGLLLLAALRRGQLDRTVHPSP